MQLFLLLYTEVNPSTCGVAHSGSFMLIGGEGGEGKHGVCICEVFIMITGQLP